jgi:malonyl-CoA O-methyltransferase
MPIEPDTVDDMADPYFALDRSAVMRSFGRAAAHYERAAWLQRRVRADLLDRLQFFTLAPQRVLDLGAGTCQSALDLRRRFPKAQIIALDLAESMLREAPRPRWPWQPRLALVCADAQRLPLATACVDLIYSNLMLQWCDQPDIAFGELARVLKPGGLMLFSTFGPDTLRELRDAWSTVDSQEHVSQFLDMPQLGDAMARAGFAEPVLDVEHHQAHYPDARALMRELKQLGARNAMTQRARGLTGRKRFAAMLATYEQLRTKAGVPATFEVIAGAAFGAGAPPAGVSRGEHGEIGISIDAIRRTRR